MAALENAPRVTRKPHRIVPVIPHALDQRRRSRKLQPQAQAGVSEAPSDGFSLSVHEASSMRKNEEISKPTTPNGEDPIAPMPNGTDSAHNEEFLPVPRAPAVEEQAVNGEVERIEDPRNKPDETEADTNAVATPTCGATAKAPTPVPIHELPPPFYPARHELHPSSNASSSHDRTEAVEHPQLLQQLRPDGNGLVFGSTRDSAKSSPFYPSPLEIGHSLPQVPLAGYPSQNSTAATFVPSAQAYTGSEPQVSSTHHPHHVSAGGPWPSREFHPQAPPHFPQGRPFYPQGPRFPPPGWQPDDLSYPQRYQGAPRPNGYFQPTPDFRRFSQPYEPPSAIYPDMVPEQQQACNGPALESNIGQPPQHLNGGRSFRQHSDQFVPAPPDDSASIAQYIYSQFGNRDFADYVLHLSHSRYLFPSTSLPAHGVILARSPKLRSLMAMQHGGYQGQQGYPKFLNVVISDRFLSHDFAFMKALMRLYGDVLPDKGFVAKLPPSLNQQDASSSHQEAMRFALTYAAAGHFLQTDEIIMHGLNLAAGFLTWETVSSALAFALEGGLSSSFSQFEQSSEDKGSSSSFDDIPSKLDSPVSTPTYGMYSDRMIHHVLGFVIHNFPHTFKLDASAPQLYEIARLPAIGERRHSRSDSRFSQIRFGEMTLDEDRQPITDSGTMTLSSVLLSLPYLLLRHILESAILGDRLGWQKVAEIAHTNVNEREERRQRAMAGRSSAAPHSAVEERLWRNVRWAENVEPTDQYPSGFRLARHAVGVDTPVSGSSIKSGAL